MINASFGVFTAQFCSSEMCLCAAVWEFLAFLRLLVPPHSGSSSVILWHSIALLNTRLCSDTAVRTSVWSCFASKFQQYEVFFNHTYKIHILVDYLTIYDHLVSFLENCIAGRTVPTKPAEYSVKIFAVIDVTALCTEHVQQYRARNKKDKNNAASVWSGYTDIKYPICMKERRCAPSLKYAQGRSKGTKRCLPQSDEMEVR
jgi:hypothetical protein